MKDTNISYARHTFNPWWGCEKPLLQIGEKLEVSPECVNCYAESWDKRCGGKHWGRSAGRQAFGQNHWKQPLAWNRALKRADERARVLCGSMCDVLEDRRDLDEHRKRLWDLIADTRNLDWMLLTKRHDQLQTLVPSWVWGLSNVWPGVTAGCQASANLRIPSLIDLKQRYPHLVIWVSCEPMTEFVDFLRILLSNGASLNALNGTINFKTLGSSSSSDRMLGVLRSGASFEHFLAAKTQTLDLIVFGGDSASFKSARRCNLDYMSIAVDDCLQRGVAAYVKQVGSRPHWTGEDPWKPKSKAGRDIKDFPTFLRVRNLPKGYL